MRKLAPTTSFVRDLDKFIIQHKDLSKTIEKVFRLLENDVKAAPLHTHKLHGKLLKLYACSINYKYRLIFEFDDEHIYLHYVGAHDDVY